MSPDERGDKRHGQQGKADEERHGEPHPADVHQRVVGPVILSCGCGKSKARSFFVQIIHLSALGDLGYDVTWK